MSCRLIKFRSLCEYGCLFRDQTFRHLRCPELPNTAACVAPCAPRERCPCTVPNKTQSLPPNNLPCLS
jgi:hypothetical protein